MGLRSNIAAHAHSACIEMCSPNPCAASSDLPGFAAPPGLAIHGRYDDQDPPGFGARMPRLSYKLGDFDLVVRRSKTGLGLFAESEIPKGSCIIEYFGPQLTAEQENKSRSKYLFE